ncbi:Adenylate cyclase [Rhodopirellula islandica]|uniref:Adenylate cyclase n=1 Tax=Rhodopirellula islandica TaxID=595434 RepID=A0A0J1BGZ2_RHOIS|nr:class IV adenylate cyclase [Rhodopirellula islandica]KLU05791.1 Adenylate cyclase [Rhodopirellula islandica]
MFEVELKFRVGNVDELRERLAENDAVLVSENENQDTYYNHPSRDFAESGEALRVRRIDGTPLVTYKGSKRPGAVKAREELEWRLDPGDPTGESMETLFDRLGFQKVATVTKQRETFHLGSTDPMTVTIDRVDGLGEFAEIERVLHERSPSDEAVETARSEVVGLATALGLDAPESRSYLRMQLELSGG